jgi:hypothetical protein
VKKNILIIICVVFHHILLAQTWSGVYNFNKGLNKAQGCIYINQFKTDSAFFYLTFVSGEPEFNTFSLKGFIGITEGQADYVKGDTTKLHFALGANTLTIRNDSLFGLEPGIITKYKKSSSSLKKTSTIYFDYAEKSAVAKSDTVWAYEVPNTECKNVCRLSKKDAIKVIDTYGYFYLVETPGKNKEFLWVPKKNLSLSKN